MGGQIRKKFISAIWTEPAAAGKHFCRCWMPDFLWNLTHVGRFKYHSDAFELELFKTFLKLGYENQLLFSLDTTRERLKTYTPEGVGLTYILETFLPAMRESGITERQIEKISVENPARILAW